ncbi:MAG: 16S rRNA (guanine(527)-N(7))-methyltransferase RsmG [Candidatus Cloacimonetes bacterium]|nr:16S rRNA (guanine(527)-N(7))-methyltransferase RsmG [Candidatus Cloacimonadota bacterium]
MNDPMFHMEQALSSYTAMLAQTGKRVNLVSRHDLPRLKELHIDPCLRFAQILKELEPKLVLDLGSGGGLPGIPCALANPETQVLLCESLGKKAEFLLRVVHRLGLKNVSVLPQRIEQLELERQPDLITARFFGTVEEILQITSSCREPFTRYLLIKGEDESLPIQALGYRLESSSPIGNGKRAVLYIPEGTPA